MVYTIWVETHNSRLNGVTDAVGGDGGQWGDVHDGDDVDQCPGQAGRQHVQCALHVLEEGPGVQFILRGN